MPIRCVAGFRTIDVQPMEGTVDVGGDSKSFTFEGSFMVPFGADVFVSGTFDFSGACDKLRDYLLDEYPAYPWDVYYDNQINRCIFSSSVATDFTFDRSSQRAYGFDASYSSVKIITGSRAPFYIWSSTYDERAADSEMFEAESFITERLADSGRAYSIGRQTVMKERNWIFQNEPASNVYTKYSSSLEPYTWERFIKNLRRSPTPFVLIPSYVTKSRIDYDDREAVYEMKARSFAFAPGVGITDYHDYFNIRVDCRVYNERNRNPSVLPIGFPVNENRFYYGPPVLEVHYGFNPGDVLGVDSALPIAWDDIVTPFVQSRTVLDNSAEEESTYQYNVYASTRNSFGITNLRKRLGPSSAPPTTASINTRIEQNEFYIKVDTVNALGVTNTTETIYFTTPLVLNLPNHSQSLNGSGSNAIAHYRGDQNVNLNTRNVLTGWGDTTSHTNDLFVTGSSADLKISSDSLLNNKPALYLPGDEGSYLALENGNISGSSATVVTGGLSMLAVISNPQGGFHDTGSLGIFGVKDLVNETQEMMLTFVSGTGQVALSRKSNSSSLPDIVTPYEVPTGSWVLAEWNFETEKARMWVNNALVEIIRDPTGSQLDFDNLGIAMGVYTTGSWSNPRTRVAEAIIWEGFVTSSIRDNIHEYVDIRYSDASGNGLDVTLIPTSSNVTFGIISSNSSSLTSISGTEYYVHTFLTGGNLNLTIQEDTPHPYDYFMVAGGGAGGSHDGEIGGGGGGGAGGVLTGSVTMTSNELIAITIGTGGTGSGVSGNGGDSIMSSSITLTAVGGGRGGQPSTTGSDGGSGGGGGGGENSGPTWSGGNAIGGNIGNSGGRGAEALPTAGRRSGGGGGAGTAGQDEQGGGVGGDGGTGIWSAFDGTGSYYAGGGGGHGGTTHGSGGLGGGGRGGNSTTGAPTTAGTDGLGGGGGGGSAASSDGAAGGSGIVMVRYPKTPNSLLATGSMDAWFVLGNPGPLNLIATGGDTIVTQSISGSEYIIHHFTTTGSGSFQVLNTGSFTRGSVEYLVVAGGAGVGGANAGGGAGGCLTGSATVTDTTYNVVVGAGGAGTTPQVKGNDGLNSDFGAFATAFGGGAGGFFGGNANHGGSGGGGGHGSSTTSPGTGSVGQGNDGGSGTYALGAGRSGGGGGWGEVGDDAGTGADQTGGDGGDGIWYDITGTGSFYGGGGGGWSKNSTPGLGGQGGGGDATGGTGAGNGNSGAANTGGGGGSAAATGTGGSGGSGIVIIRYKTTGLLS